MTSAAAGSGTNGQGVSLELIGLPVGTVSGIGLLALVQVLARGDAA